jgi:hypothetical protein
VTATRANAEAFYFPASPSGRRRRKGVFVDIDSSTSGPSRTTTNRGHGKELAGGDWMIRWRSIVQKKKGRIRWEGS